VMLKDGKVISDQPTARAEAGAAVAPSAPIAVS
jgi:hypothetical protein